MKESIKKYLMLAPLAIVSCLLIFPIWSHIYQAQELLVQDNKIKDIESIIVNGSSDPFGDEQLAGGITRVKIGLQTAWTTSLIPSASFTVDVGSLTLPVRNYFGAGASLSGNLNFNGEIKPDGSLCSNGDILQRTGANDWDCVPLVASVASNSIGFGAFVNPLKADTDVSLLANGFSYTFDRASTSGIFETSTLKADTISGSTGTGITFSAAGSNSFTGSLSITKGLTAGSYQGAGLGPCSAVTKVLRFNIGQFSCGTLGASDITALGALTISSGVVWTTAGTLTIGDNGDRIDFDSNTWDVSNGVFSGLAGLTSTGTVDFSGATLFKMVSAAAPTINANGEIALNTTSGSFDWYDGANQEVIRKNGTCFTYIVDSPTASNPGKVTGKIFNDPFTITEVREVASGSNAAGWNLRYGNPGAVTTSVFTTNRSASTSLYPTYTNFANSTLTDGQVLEVNITSRSAVLQTFAVTVCGRYQH